MDDNGHGYDRLTPEQAVEARRPPWCRTCAVEDGLMVPLANRAVGQDEFDVLECPRCERRTYIQRTEARKTEDMLARMGIGSATGVKPAEVEVSINCASLPPGARGIYMNRITAGVPISCAEALRQYQIGVEE